MTAVPLGQIMPNDANLHSVLMDIEFIFKVDRRCLSSLSGHFNFFYICIKYEAYTMTFKVTLSQTYSSYTEIYGLLIHKTQQFQSTQTKRGIFLYGIKSSLSIVTLTDTHAGSKRLSK